MDYVFFAWLSVIALGIVLVPYVMNFLNRKLLKTKNETYRKTLKFFRKLHKPAGILFVIAAYIHGYMVMGTVFRLHTGSLLYLFVLSTAILGVVFYKRKRRPWFRWHKITALISVILFLLHFFKPWAI